MTDREKEIREGLLRIKKIQNGEFIPGTMLEDIDFLLSIINALRAEKEKLERKISIAVSGDIFMAASKIQELEAENAAMREAINEIGEIASSYDEELSTVDEEATGLFGLILVECIKCKLTEVVK